MNNFKVLFVLLIFIVTSCSTVPTFVSLAPPHALIVQGKSVPVVAHPAPASLLSSRDLELETNKRLVFNFWRTVLNAGHFEKTDDYLHPDYKEYSLVSASGLEGVKNSVRARVNRADTVPATIQDPVVTIVAEKDLVAVVTVAHYFEPDGSGNTYTSSHFDLFKIADGKIAAHWDSAQLTKGMQQIPKEEAGPLPVRGIVGVEQLGLLMSDDPVLAANKRLVFDLWRQTAEGGREELAPLYLDPIYIQHNPNAATGRAGFIEYMSNRPDTDIESHYERPLIAIIAEGDLVVQALVGTRLDPNSPGMDLEIAWFDMFRIKDRRIIEHWDTASKGEVPKDHRTTP